MGKKLLGCWNMSPISVDIYSIYSVDIYTVDIYTGCWNMPPILTEVTFVICHPTLLIFGDKWLQKIGAVQNSFALCMHTMIFIFINDM